MSRPSSQRVELVEGNQSLRTLMRGILTEGGFACLDDEPDTPADLLVVDIDNLETPGQDRRKLYRQVGRPILVCGLGGGDDVEGDAHWLSRPFNPDELMVACRKALGLESEALTPAESGSTPTDRPATREIDYTDVPVDGEVEGDIAEPGAGTGDGSTASHRPRGAEDSEILEIDDASSMVVDVQELEEHVSTGGSMEGTVSARDLDVEGLYDAVNDLEPVGTFEDSKTNPTLPDVPTSKEDGEGSGLASNSSPPSAGSTGAHANRSLGSNPRDPDGRGATEQPSVESSRPADEGSPEPTGSRSDSVSPSFRRDFRELATRLANSWDRIGLTARWEDRAERLTRTFEALVERGLSGASRELERVPPAHGFSGTIEIFPTFQLIDVIVARNLLGRLEISNQEGGYVLYFDGLQLVGVDDLEGRSDAMLLDCLRETEELDADAYRRLRRRLNESLTTPLEMRLRTEEIVTDAALEAARRTRAKWVLKEVMRMDRGTFAFIGGGAESGQPWPGNELDVHIDGLALELLREGSCDVDVAEVRGGATFVAVSDLMERSGDEQIVEFERKLLAACRSPRSLEGLEQTLDTPTDEIADALQRLEAVGLLQQVSRGGADADETAEVETIDPDEVAEDDKTE